MDEDEAQRDRIIAGVEAVLAAEGFVMPDLMLIAEHRPDVESNSTRLSIFVPESQRWTVTAGFVFQAEAWARSVEESQWNGGE